MATSTNTSIVTQTTPLLSNVNQVTYSGSDFSTISDSLRAQLQLAFASSFNDFSSSSLGLLLISEVAYGLDQLSFYLDRRASDNYLQTAQTQQSVARLTRQLGYKMGAAVSSSTDLNISLQQKYPFNVPIPAGFQFLGPNSLIYQTGQALTINSGDLTTHSVPAYEGQSFSESFVSDGTANQVFTLSRVPSGLSVVSGTVTVLVNGTPYEEVTFINFDTQNEFEVGYNDSPPTVRFGDGVAGTIPAINTTIVVSYVAGSGAAGLVTANTITSVVQPLVVNFQSIPLNVTNPAGSVGGSDPETIEHAKAFAGKVFKTRMVAVTTEDYDSLAGSYADPLYGRVALAQALSTRSAAQDLALQIQLDDITNEVNTPLPYAGQVPDVSTTISAASNGIALPQLVINVASTVGFPEAGTISVTTSTGVNTVSYSGNSGGTQFTGCTGGTGLMNTGNGVTGPFVDGVYISDMKMRLATLSQTTTSINSDISGIGTLNTSINGNLNTILTNAQTTRSAAIDLQNYAGDIGTDASTLTTSLSGFPISGANNLSVATASTLTANINSALTDPTNGINAITVSGANTLTSATKSFLQSVLGTAITAISVIPNTTGSQLTSADQVTLTGLTSDITSKSSKINTSAGTIQSTLTNQVIATANTAATTLAAIGLTPTSASSILLDLTNKNTVIEDQVGDTSAFPIPPLVVTQPNPVTGVDQTYTYPLAGFTLVSDVATVQGAIVDQSSVIDAATTTIYNHVDSLLAADCQSNLVTVPILSVDATGFFAPPSTGLTQSLQNYLTGIKEVTQTVQVVSGANFLVPAVIQIRSGYLTGYAQSTIETAISAACDNVLKGRTFGASLYDSELCDAIDAIPGVAFTNVTILGSQVSITNTTLTTQFLDQSGNLIITDSYVITKGSVTVLTPELVVE